MKNNNWENEIREKLDSYSTVDLDGLWERVESATEPRRIAFTSWKKAGVAAASIVAAAAVVMSVLPHKPSDEPSVYIAKTADSQIVESNTYTIENTSDSEKYGIVKNADRGFLAAVSNVDTVKTIPASEPKPETIRELEEPEDCVSTPEPRQSEKKQETVSIDDSWQDFEELVEDSRRKSRIALLADGVGALAGAANSNGPVMVSDANSISDVTALLRSPESEDSRTEPASSYSWSVGASASIRAEFGLNDWLDMSGGLSWTMLNGSNRYDAYRPSLQYVGIPILLGARLAGNDSFSVKAVCGPRVDLLVKGSPDIEAGPLQLSVHGGLQAACMISRRLGFSAGFGSDLYIPDKDKDSSPFSSSTAVANISFGLLFRL